ncbi:hypothetical protein [Leptolyngbya ohadii]|uniref:hypothetical protein n=1 Tax=Leptolyngbya ohadii TaxID=1962290 RepID=UPI000B59B2A0|nr:hypothetical protein [Leptolyngbya ohadii]
MTASSSPTLQKFIQDHPRTYEKLCYWAGRRKIRNPSEQVQQYLLELVLEANPEQNNRELLRKWAVFLSKQEKIAIAYLSPILVSNYESVGMWYTLDKGEYSVLEEPVLSEISYEGQRQAVVTRNRYNCLILNCDRLLIVDVDLADPEQAEIQDCAASCPVALSQRQAISALEALVEHSPQLGFRVYKTRNGLRYLCTTQTFDPLEQTTHRIMESLYVDPLYLKLCKFQATFRARLTPKPWRVEPGEDTQQFIYDRVTGTVLPTCNRYSVCHLIEILGQQEILPQFEPIIEQHDSYCRVSRLGLELA